MGKKKDKKAKEGKVVEEEKRRHGGLHKEPSDFVNKSYRSVLLRRRQILCHRLDPDQPDPLEDFFQSDRASLLLPLDLLEEENQSHTTNSDPPQMAPSKTASSFGLGPSTVVNNHPRDYDRAQTATNMLAPSNKRRGTLVSASQTSLDVQQPLGRKATLPPSSAFIFPKQRPESDLSLSSPRSRSPSLGRSQTAAHTLRISPAPPSNSLSSQTSSAPQVRPYSPCHSSPLLIKKPPPPARPPRSPRQSMTKGESMAILVSLDSSDADRPLPNLPSFANQLTIPSSYTTKRKRGSTGSPPIIIGEEGKGEKKEKPSRASTPPPTRSGSFGLDEGVGGDGGGIESKSSPTRGTPKETAATLYGGASEATLSQCSPARTTESATPRTPSPPPLDSYTSFLPTGALPPSSPFSSSLTPPPSAYTSPALNLLPSINSSSDDSPFLDSYASPILAQYTLENSNSLSPYLSSPVIPSPRFSPRSSPNRSPYLSTLPPLGRVDGYQSPINLGSGVGEHNAYTSGIENPQAPEPLTERRSKWSSPKSATLYGQGKVGGGEKGGEEGKGVGRLSVEKTSGDWNGRFQDMVGSFKVIDILDMAHSGEVILDLIRLNQDFLVNAETYGRIIIMERHLPLPTENNKDGFTKTLIPMDIGGRAGGQKYLINNILFKFAVDVHNLYGSDYAAAKAAGNELRGLNAIFNKGNNKLCFPFMALIDFLGVRLIAMSRLPISAQTLVYGTADGGVTVFNENQELSDLIADAADKMKLATHVCGLHEHRTKTLSTAADIEGHVGRDGRFYMIDFARMFPPTTPDTRVKRGYLYQVMRPEIVGMGHKLCPDTYSGFIAQDPKKSLYEAQVGVATEQLTTKVAKKVAQEIQVGCRLKGNFQRLLLHLPEVMHRRGLNLRYLGLLLNNISNPSARMLVILEAAARVIKNNLRSHIRQASQKLQIPMEAPYRELIVRRLDDILCSNEKEQLHYWEENEIVKSLKVRFNFSNFLLFTKGKEEGMTDGLTEEERRDLAPDDPLRVVRLLSVVEPKEKMMGRWIVFKRVQEMTGIRFAQEINERFRSEDTTAALDEVDLETLSVKVKRQSFVNTVQGLYFYSKALRESDYTKSKGLFQRAIRSYELCLQSDPTNFLSLVSAAQCCYKLALYEASGGKGMTVTVLDPAEERVITADNLYQRALQVGESEPHVYYLYAQFLDSCQKTPLITQKAEKYHLLGCETWPLSRANLHGYAAHLRRKGEGLWAEKFEEKANRCSNNGMGR